MRRSAALLALLFALLLPWTARAQQAPAATAPTQSSPAKSVAPSSGTSSTQGNPEIKVWVNTNSGVYHCPGSHWYGATKSGSYLKQSEAQQKGYRPAYHRACK